MAVEFLSPIADASQFPISAVPATPEFRITELDILHKSRIGLKNATYTRNGRGALGIAGQALKKSGKNVILIPAYHCPALVEPFIWLGYEIRFYPIESDLSTDIEKLKKLLSLGDVTHCVVIRYFGFHQNIYELIDFLANNQIDVIEDCAHALFAFMTHFTPEKQINYRVNASICSINKILPSIDGGALYLKDPVQTKLQRIEWTDEIKACAYLIGIPQLVGKLKNWLKANPEKFAPNIGDELENEDSHLRYFQHIDLESASYRHTKLILYHSDLNKIKAKRRDNFNYLTSHIDNPAIGRVLYDNLEDDDVPYVLPFLLKNNKHFETLRKQGIQILRWEEVAKSECVVSQQYRSHLIQIPCHQQLTVGQLDFIVSSINHLHC